MLRKRDGYVALGDVAGAVKPPGDRALPPAPTRSKYGPTSLCVTR